MTSDGNPILWLDHQSHHRWANRAAYGCLEAEARGSDNHRYIRAPRGTNAPLVAS